MNVNPRESLKYIKQYFNLMHDKEDEREVVEQVRGSIVFRGTNLWILIFAILIASLGLGEQWRIVFALLMALLIGLAFGLVQGYLIACLQIQPFIITLAGMFFARGMITIISVDPQKAPQELMDILQNRIEIAWLGSPNKKGVMIPARMEIGVIVALAVVFLVYFLFA